MQHIRKYSLVSCSWKKKRQVVLVGERLSVLGKLSPAPLWDANMDNLRVIWRISDFLPSGTAVNADN